MMKSWLVLILIMLNVLCISAMGQGSENPFGSTYSDPISLKGDEGVGLALDFSPLEPNFEDY